MDSKFEKAITELTNTIERKEMKIQKLIDSNTKNQTNLKRLGAKHRATLKRMERIQASTMDVELGDAIDRMEKIIDTLEVLHANT